MRSVQGKLDGRVAVVTGGTRGIGRAIAEAYLAEGARVVVSGRSPEKGQRALEEMDAGEGAHFIPCDVLEQSQVEHLIDESARHFGTVDILVNNAGGSDGFAMVHELSDEAWNRALDWNLNSNFWATRRILPYMLANRWGRIICVSSVEGKQANKAMVSHYITNKHALHGLVKAVAFEYGPDGITSNAICPGVIETDLTRDAGAKAAAAMGITYEEFLDRYAQDSMIKRINRVEEVAATAVLLASEIGGGITGTLLNVDGGSSSW
jgi:NAD(P)-dependent dehydrogenase (short-subunit alcohol dehydrogenase family)